MDGIPTRGNGETGDVECLFYGVMWVFVDGKAGFNAVDICLEGITNFYVGFGLYDETGVANVVVVPLLVLRREWEGMELVS